MEITLKNVGYRYKNKKILDHINLTIKDKQITGITGEYKTLLCEMIDAVKLTDIGSITIGDALLNNDNLKWIRKEVCLIQQNYQKQFFTNSVKEEIFFLVSRLSYKPKDLNKKMEQSLEMVGLDKTYLNKKIKMLSNGEKKLLQVAVGLIYNPNIIIFDEPFVELDYINQRKLLKLIKMLKEKYQKTILITSNNCNLLYEITDNIVILKKGHVLISDNTVKVYQDVDFLLNHEIEIPDLIQFTMLARKKRIKLSFHRDIRDLIKDVYKHV